MLGPVGFPPLGEATLSKGEFKRVTISACIPLPQTGTQGQVEPAGNNLAATPYYIVILHFSKYNLTYCFLGFS